MTTLEIANLYFDLSNKSDFAGIAELLTDQTTYESQNTGTYQGRDKIIKMQRAFHGKFSSLKWTVKLIDELEAGVILFVYTFDGIRKDGKSVKSAGQEFITVADGRITNIEIQNK